MNRLMLFLILFSFLCAISYSAITSKQDYSPSDIPNPMQNTDSALTCGRPGVVKSGICDPGNLLDKETKDVIEGYMNDITKAEIGLVVVKAMTKNFVGYKSIEAASENFARTVHDTWGVGSANSNNGILVFLSIDDRAVFISTGQGVERKLGSRVIESVISHMKSYLRQERYGKALELCVVEIGLILDGKATPSSSTDGSPFLLFFLAVICVGVWVKSYYDNQATKQLERGKTALNKLMTEVSNEQNGNRFECTSCPICLEDFPLNSNVGDESGGTAERYAHHGGVGRAGNGGGDSTEPAATSGNARRPMKLQCDHVFCFDCLQSHLKSPSGTTCPICRQPVDLDAPAPSRAPRAPPTRLPPYQAPPPAANHGDSATAFGAGSAGAGSSGASSRGTSRGGSSTGASDGTRGGSGDSGAGGAGGTGVASSATDPLNPSVPRSIYGIAYAGAYGGGADSSDAPSCSSTSSSSTGASSSFSSHSADAFSSDTSRTSPLNRPHNNFWARRGPEYHFRLNRMRHLYPNVMTDHSYRAMSRAIDGQSTAEFTAAAQARVSEVQQIITDTQRRAAAASRGSRGSSHSSFGGGRSHGGGGGRW